MLVISPFASTVEVQYARRALLWRNPDILPGFDLATIRAPLSAGIAPPEDSDWFAALERMQRQMDQLDYDVALIGAGALSLPLAAHAKAQGRVGIHLGGALQILFGIIGARWEKSSGFAAIVNEHWRRPSAAETPDAHHRVEGGCYW